MAIADRTIKIIRQFFGKSKKFNYQLWQQKVDNQKFIIEIKYPI